MAVSCSGTEALVPLFQCIPSPPRSKFAKKVPLPPGRLLSTGKDGGGSLFTHQGRSRQGEVGTRRWRWGAGGRETKSWVRSEVTAPNPQSPGFAAP